MKLLLIGPTGPIGSTILHQCLANPFITCLVVLSRRPLSTEIYNSDPRVKILIVDSFTVYDGDVLEELEEAIGCLWCLGHSRPKDSGDARKTDIDTTVAAASAFASYLAAVPKIEGQTPFRFVCLNSLHVGNNHRRRSLGFISGSRRMKGETEKQLISLSKRSGSSFEAYIARPGYILRPENRYPKLFLAMMGGIRVDQLASCMIDCVIHGNPKKVIEHQELIDGGKVLLANKV